MNHPGRDDFTVTDLTIELSDSFTKATPNPTPPPTGNALAIRPPQPMTITDAGTVCPPTIAPSSSTNRSHHPSQSWCVELVVPSTVALAAPFVLRSWRGVARLPLTLRNTDPTGGHGHSSFGAPIGIGVVTPPRSCRMSVVGTN